MQETIRSSVSVHHSTSQYTPVNTILISDDNDFIYNLLNLECADVEHGKLLMKQIRTNLSRRIHDQHISIHIMKVLCSSSSSSKKVFGESPSLGEHKVFEILSQHGIESCTLHAIDSMQKEGKFGFLLLTFDPGGEEAITYAPKHIFVDNNDFVITDVLSLEREGIKNGIDMEGGFGTFTARMTERNVTMITNILNIDAPISELVDTRGLFPLYLSLYHRVPFYDNVFDLAHAGSRLVVGEKPEKKEFLMIDIDSILRAGFFWLDKFFCEMDETFDKLTDSIRVVLVAKYVAVGNFQPEDKGLTIEMVQYFSFFNRTNKHVNKGGVTYTNVFDASLDPLIWPLEKAGYLEMAVIFGEVGCPTDGVENANTQNTKRCNQGLLRYILSKNGNPARRGTLEVYIFSLIDENAKSIVLASFERLSLEFTGKPKYGLDFSGGEENEGLVLVEGVEYRQRQWCVIDPQMVDLADLARSIGYYCSLSDCTTLDYGTSCNYLSWRGNVSYAIPLYYQVNDQKKWDCHLSGLVIVTVEDPWDCEFPMMFAYGYSLTLEWHSWWTICCQGIVSVIFFVLNTLIWDEKSYGLCHLALFCYGVLMVWLISSTRVFG
ncbi:hypothetical protein HS088_TW22G01012 [Tripterygium wilfordii]|uniref:glucan endo-1,3-beta-D-glucosidase n=2 Tax=Tripterygium wilfordii TaxID=458696 RepID=A0A7J7BZJ1_TRIWF|nr:hypothetical protein HS088_TW22G01012 [Tripterygium wilfordii]